MKISNRTVFISVLTGILVITLLIAFQSANAGVMASEQPGCDDGTLAQMQKDKKSGKEQENNIDDNCGQVVYHPTPIIGHKITPTPRPSTVPCIPPCDSRLKIPCMIPFHVRFCMTPTPTETPVPSATPTPTEMPTETPTPTTTEPSATPTPTSTVVPTNTPTPTQTSGDTNTNNNNNNNTQSQDQTQNNNQNVNVTVDNSNQQSVLGANTQTASQLPSTGSPVETWVSLFGLLPVGFGLKKFALKK